ncbi:hypothetical protein Tco_1134097 [Tanacetum coccineum]
MELCHFSSTHLGKFGSPFEEERLVFRPSGDEHVFIHAAVSNEGYKYPTLDVQTLNIFSIASIQGTNALRLACNWLLGVTSILTELEEDASETGLSFRRIIGVKKHYCQTDRQCCSNIRITCGWLEVLDEEHEPELSEIRRLSEGTTSSS